MGQSLSLCGSRHHFEEECNIQSINPSINPEEYDRNSNSFDDFTLKQSTEQSINSIRYYQDSDDEDVEQQYQHRSLKQTNNQSMPYINSTSSLDSFNQSTHQVFDPYCSTDEDSSPLSSRASPDQITHSIHQSNNHLKLQSSYQSTYQPVNQSNNYTLTVPQRSSSGVLRSANQPTYRIAHSRSHTTLSIDQTSLSHSGYYSNQSSPDHLSPDYQQDNQTNNLSRPFRSHRRPPPFEAVHPSAFQPINQPIHRPVPKLAQLDDSPPCGPSRSIFHTPRKQSFNQTIEPVSPGSHPGTALSLLRESRCL